MFVHPIDPLDFFDKFPLLVICYLKHILLTLNNSEVLRG